jgi:hypothetical protein
VEALLDEDEELLVDECKRLVPLLSSIEKKWRRKEKTQEKKW